MRDAMNGTTEVAKENVYCTRNLVDNEETLITGTCKDGKIVVKTDRKTGHGKADGESCGPKHER